MGLLTHLTENDYEVSMSLACSCDFDPADFDSWWEGPGKLQLMPVLGRRKKCCACGSLINPGDEVFKFHRYRHIKSDIEERIYGDYAVPLAAAYTCEECSDLISAVEDLGMCYSLDEPIKDQVAEYMEAVRAYEMHIKKNPGKADEWSIEDFIGC
ncbi:MAG: hypothetical protein DBP02_01915 [gamma proteobacterium symbiont of Ctena orbiculata]|nr:MAG: hypothetical protein DBP02_01915 [gamma proteobacterium symbiont of Ctena orbiculata]